ncbi:MAG: mechanosensitive ion channel family protein [Planctomycetes bacterium]|nr:mechanosensitive ion channel family protein [Planctomycetota bacterium]
MRLLRTGIIFGMAWLVFCGVASAQMPGMTAAEKEAPKQESTTPESQVEGWSGKLMGPYRGLMLGVITLVVLLILRKISTRYVRKQVADRAFKEENALKFMRTWKSLWTFLITVITLIALSGSLSLLGLSAGFLGMMLGWSLQAPVTGIAAWLMLVVKRPFKIGDRVIIAGIIGDVTDITLTHIVLNQVGGTVGGEERSGRGILIPNAIMFGQVITNYTLDAKYMLDEVPVRVTFDSDFELAKKILLEAAQSVTQDIIAETGQEAFIRCEFFDAGVLVRLRYQTVGSRRQEISSLIVEIILAQFKQNFPRVKFCFPHTVVRYSMDDEGQRELPPVGDGIQQ